MKGMRTKTYRKRIKDCMVALGTYKKEFDKTIEDLAKLYEDLDAAREEFEKSGKRYVLEHTNKAGQTNLVKNPLYLTIEGMQGRILVHNKELGLTPAGLKKIKGDEADGETRSGLMEALMSLES
nr:MAG TPA: terminase small subunit [Caudoviricetes sp.]